VNKDKSKGRGSRASAPSLRKNAAYALQGACEFSLPFAPVEPLPGLLSETGGATWSEVAIPGLDPSGVLPTALEFSGAQVPAGTVGSLMARAGALSAPKSSAAVKVTDNARFTLLNSKASFP
jgi:hypothetical protein